MTWLSVSIVTSEGVTSDEILSVGMDGGLHDDLLDVADWLFLHPPGPVLHLLQVGLDPDLGVSTVDRDGEERVGGVHHPNKGEH